MRVNNYFDFVNSLVPNMTAYKFPSMCFVYLLIFLLGWIFGSYFTFLYLDWNQIQRPTSSSNSARTSKLVSKNTIPPRLRSGFETFDKRDGDHVEKEKEKSLFEMLEVFVNDYLNEGISHKEAKDDYREGEESQSPKNYNSLLEVEKRGNSTTIDQFRQYVNAETIRAFLSHLMESSSELEYQSPIQTNERFDKTETIRSKQGEEEEKHHLLRRFFRDYLKSLPSNKDDEKDVHKEKSTHLYNTSKPLVFDGTHIEPIEPLLDTTTKENRSVDHNKNGRQGLRDKLVPHKLVQERNNDNNLNSTIGLLNVF